MINNRNGRPLVRGESPAQVGELLADFEARTGAAHTAAFDLDGVLLGHAGHPADEAATARAEQSASSSYMLASLSTGVGTTLPSLSRPEGLGRPDHLLLRYRDQKTAKSSPWWVLVVPVPEWGGLVTEIPPSSDASVTAVMSELLLCSEHIHAVLAEAGLAAR
ncbi:hypothetical protein SUDANB121_00764 [Nocardiopsis dassonvillei]|uniref:hypothetical protein n=1 Tax=Nocardiopsis dassonvillei TaxID=2014 RepID=UPI003F562E27